MGRRATGIGARLDPQSYPNGRFARLHDREGNSIELWQPKAPGASGKVPLTFPVSEADLPHPKRAVQPAPDAAHPIPQLRGFPEPVATIINVGPTFDVVYDEGLKVGYKWYDAEKKPVLFPFGFGLSYTTFAFSAIAATPGDPTTVTFTVKNTGTRAGTEIAEVYASLPAAAEEPPKRLVGWTRVQLAPGESKQLSVPVSRDRFTIFDEASDSWKLVPGDYVLRVGSSSRDLPLQQTMTF